MIKITLAFAVTAIFLGKECIAEYDIKGDHFGEDGHVHVGDGRVHVTKYVEDMAARMEVLLQRRNAADIAAKYAEDVVYLRQEHPIAFGREQVMDLYQEWFDSGVYGADITISKAVMLGDDFIASVCLFTPYDKDGLNIAEDAALVIFKRTEDGDGFQVFLKSEIVNYWQDI